MEKFKLKLLSGRQAHGGMKLGLSLGLQIILKYLQERQASVMIHLLSLRHFALSVGAQSQQLQTFMLH